MISRIKTKIIRRLTGFVDEGEYIGSPIKLRTIIPDEEVEYVSKFNGESVTFWTNFNWDLYKSILNSKKL